MRRGKIAAFALASVVLLGSLFHIPAEAGMRTLVSEPITNDAQLNSTGWSFLGDISVEDEKVVISPDTSDADTRFIAKNLVKRSEEVSDMVEVDATLKLTSLSADTSFIFGFGLSSIEAYSGEDGNAEIVISNKNGLKMSVVAYADGEASTVLLEKSMGCSLNREFTLNAVISNQGVLTVHINGTKFCSEQLPVSGEGRFGILQTGSCGAEFSELSLICRDYDRPENTEIVEDFEKGDFNAGVLCSRIIGVGMAPASFTVKDYNGNKVMMFQNTAQAYLGTLHSYSNFEISFDIPYWPGADICDEQGNVVTMKGDSICIGFGESTAAPKSATYSEDMDFIRLYRTSAVSELREAFDVSYAVAGMPQESDDEGYSVKFTLLDGHGELQVKPLSATEYTTVAEADYDVQQSGYVNLWTTNGGTIAIDNLKITNKDVNPNSIEVEYQTSVMTFEDYDITQESTKMVFREDVTETSAGIDIITLIALCCVIEAGVLTITGMVVGNILSRKKMEGGKADEKI